MTYCPNCGVPLSEKKVDGVMRRVCQQDGCGYVHWDNPVPVVAALVRHNDRYIIARNSAWPAGIFSVITGYLEQKENPEQAVLREVQEELGLQGKVTRFLGIHSFFEKNQLILAYEVEARGEVATNHEIAETLLLTDKELRKYDFAPLYITQAIMNVWSGEAL